MIPVSFYTVSFYPVGVENRTNGAGPPGHDELAGRLGGGA